MKPRQEYIIHQLRIDRALGLLLDQFDGLPIAHCVFGVLVQVSLVIRTHAFHLAHRDEMVPAPGLRIVLVQFDLVALHGVNDTNAATASGHDRHVFPDILRVHGLLRT
jgi:hypothetical protein